MLAPTDMVLHSATHLFHNEEFSHGLRDLVDIDLLLRHFGTDPQFWGALTDRAERMNLTRLLCYALRFTGRLLDTPIPESATLAVSRHAPGALTSATMDALLTHGLRPTMGLRSTRVARRLLYVRGHWLKMPVPLLAWHLTEKTF
jgi:hypothetical protein